MTEPAFSAAPRAQRRDTEGSHCLIGSTPWPGPGRLRTRLAAEDGFGLIELMAALVVLTIALLALAAGYDEAFLSLHEASQKTVAAELADRQMELYRALPYTSIGLDATTTAAVGTVGDPAYDALYADDALLAGDFVTDQETGVTSQLPSGTVNDVTISGCGSAANCLPIQTVTGTDNRSYRIETFVRDRTDPANNTGIRWTERVVTVIVQDAGTAGDPELLRLTSAFDRGPDG
jgi:prepilin-type N-terminal cleavage/methylation domain-containing protein